MPTYEYYCKACDDKFEVFQRITEAPVTECRTCGGPVRKLISPVGVVFKGPGFHVNDYRKPEAKKEYEAASKAESKTETKTETKTEAKTETAPAAAA